MARVTVEDCIRHIDNHFALVVLAARRMRQLKEGARPLVECDNKEAIQALREIAAGRVRFKESVRAALPIAYSEHFSDPRRPLPGV